MGRSDRLNLFTIPSHRSFVDGLAAGLLDETDKAELARTTVLLPNRRAVRALTEAFVRLAGGALLLPRMLPIGDVGEDETLGAFDELMALEADMPPPADNFERRMLLMQLVQRWQPRAAVEALRLADALGRTLDQLQLEEIDPKLLLENDEGEFGEHWKQTLTFLGIVVDQWPKILSASGKIDRVTRRQALLRGIAGYWQKSSPERRIVAAGLSSADPAVALLLRTVAGLPRGAVVFPGLDIASEDWDTLDNFPGHPQASMRQMLDRMGVTREEVQVWPAVSPRDGPEPRVEAIVHALALPKSTACWPKSSEYSGLKIVVAANAAEEATVIALAMRRQLETKGARAALVTPDRTLARRVTAQLGRWQIGVDDSAGTPLSRLPSGTFLTTALEAGSRKFAPGALLALLKHPLCGPEDETGRLIWLDNVRRLDLALRGVRPAPGLKGISQRVQTAAKMVMSVGEAKALETWWRDTETRLTPLQAMMDGPARLGVSADSLRAFAEGLAGERLWRGQAGRAASELIASLIAYGDAAGIIPPDDLPALFAAMANDVAVRPAYGKHPRLAIYGLLEARLQRADLMILGGLNEGVWPAADSFDPWLPPVIRRRLGLPAGERSIGLAAHDFVSAAGAGAVLLTRARRDATAPTVPSRFWLRLTAFADGRMSVDEGLLAAARTIDRRPPVPSALPPAPRPSAAQRPKKLSVTQVDRLRADPFSFYAQTILNLNVLDSLDADPSAAEKGTLVHAMLERLIEADELFDAGARRRVMGEVLAEFADQPLVGALWRPRVERMLDWVAETLAMRRDMGWHMTFAERAGTIQASGVELKGKADIVQRGPDGLAIVDFKTGRLPAARQVEAGFALQLGLLAWIAESGALADIDATAVRELAYWKLSGGERAIGEMKTTAKHFAAAWNDVTAFIAMCRGVFEEVAARYLTGSDPFEAKVHPEYAAHMHDFDHLSRLAEWQGRTR